MLTHCQGVHEDVRAVGFDHATGSLVVAGGGGARSKCPGVTVSLWEYDSGQLSMRKAHGSCKTKVSDAAPPACKCASVPASLSPCGSTVQWAAGHA